MDLLHFKRMVSLLNEISKREISEQHILGHVFFTVPQPTLLSIVELQFFFYLGQELFFRLKLGTLCPPVWVTLLWEHIFQKMSRIGAIYHFIF